jgi:hypothetical protein
MYAGIVALPARYRIVLHCSKEKMNCPRERNSTPTSPFIKTIYCTVPSLLCREIFDIDPPNVMTMKIVMTARLAEVALRKGLVAVNLKAKQPKEMTESFIRFRLNNNIITKDCKVLTVRSVIRF